MDSSTGNGDQLSPVALFGLLANRTRMAAMRALWKAEEPLSFSELADRAGVEDTGNFTYHLEKLIPNFVRKVGDNYTLTRAGQRALTAVLAGRFSEHSPIDRAVVDYECPFCGGSVVLEHGDDALRASCTDCPGIYRDRRGDERLTRIWLPPAGVREEPTATLDAALQWMFNRRWSFIRGICPECAGPVESRAEACPAHDPEDGLCGDCGRRYAVLARHRCRVCQESVSELGAVPLLADRRVQSFLNDHGHDPTDFTFENLTAILPFEEAVRERDPLRYEVRLELEGRTLSVTGDAHAEVVSVDRRDR